MPARSATIALVLLVVAFGALVLRHLGHPLLWNDEAETAMYGRRVLEFGVPRADDGRNLVYEVDVPLGVAVKESNGAYLGSTWGQYYVGALGVALGSDTSDAYERTRWVRLPFALAGLLGIGCFLALLFRSYDDALPAALPPALLFVALLLLSPSLQLHLREARHYPLALLLVALLLLVHAELHIRQSGRRVLLSVAETLLLFLVFNVFYPAWLFLVAGLGLERLLAAVAATGAPQERLRALARDCVPLAVSALLVAPIALYFDILRVGRAVGGGGALDAARWLQNLETLLLYFLQHSELLAAAVARAAAIVLARRSDRAAMDAGLARRLSTALLLWIVAATYVVLLAALPFVFERYALWILPALSLAFVLDLASCLALARKQYAANAQRIVVGMAVVAAACVLLPIAARLPALAGRLEEVRTPASGPLDFVVAYLQDTYPKPEELVIATNYEAPVLMFYLGSRVVVGYAGARLAADSRLEPDVVLPRKQWKHRGLAALEDFVQRGRFERVPFPVVDLPYNNTPSLSQAQGPRGAHQFRTLFAENERERLVLFRRLPATP